MKKILSLILTFAMVFSLAMPAMAASVTGNNSSNVTASYTPTYSITVSTDSNGNVTAPSAAAAGTTVTLTVTPNSGYELESLSVKDAANNDVTVTNNQFTMPASAVTVSATFKAAAQKYKIEIYKASTDYPAGIVTGTITSKVSEAAAGETVHLTAHPSDGYELDDVVVSYIESNKSQYVTVNEDLSFIMPASDVSVLSYFKPIVVKPKITSLYVTIDGVRYDSSNTSAENPATIYKGDSYIITVAGTDFSAINTSTNVNSPSVQYAKDESTLVGIGWTVDAAANTATIPFNWSHVKNTTTAFEISYANKEDNGNYRGSGVYIVYVDSYKPVFYDVTIADGIKNGSVTADPTSAAEGATITLTVNPDPGYELDALTINNGAITATKGEDGKYTFTMPAGDVTVSATFKKINYTITVNPSDNGSVRAPATATMGDIVKVTVEAEMGCEYVVGSLKVINDTTQEEISLNDSNEFTMPASNVTITATFNKLPITSAEIVWGSMAFTYSDEQIVQADGSTTADKGWSDSNTGWVTVKNTGNTTFTAQAAYASTTDEYGTITGSFDPASSELAAESNYTFTLKLNGKPNKAIPEGTKIGEVTITITEAAEG